MTQSASIRACQLSRGQHWQNRSMSTQLCPVLAVHPIDQIVRRSCWCLSQHSRARLAEAALADDVGVRVPVGRRL